ncbi:MAG: hypothetical protein B6I18_02260 [Bacteroidetes bacterium 4572_112]|nr:MAG: hypothetical protein B6I18_02260 [Bacteroidetes bacterium 4572_112]
MHKRNKYIIGIGKGLKWLLYSLVILLVSLYLLFRLSFVQNYTANKAAIYLSDKAGVEISIGELEISQFLKISLRDLRVRDHHDSLFLKIKSLDAEIIPAYLLEDKFFVKNLVVDSLCLALIEYKGEKEMNLMRIIDSLSGEEDTTTSSFELGIMARNVSVSNSYFALDLQNDSHYEAMDYTHLNVDSINFEIDDFTIKSDSLIGNVISFSAYEKCGFDIQKLAGNVLVSPREVEIPNMQLYVNNSGLEADFNLRYNQWSDWLEFIDNVSFDARVDSISLDLNDIQYFSTSVKGMENVVYGSAIVKGSVAKIKVKDANLRYRNNTYFKGYVALNGLPEIDQTFIRIKIKDAYVDSKELSKVKLSNGELFSLPSIADKYEFIKVKGRFTGFYYDFVSKASFNSALGRFSTDISLQPTANQKDFKYSGKLSTTHFEIQKLLGSSYVKDISMKVNIEGVGLSENIDAVYDIDISNVNVAGFDYSNLELLGSIANKKLETELKSKTDSFRLSAKGYYDFSEEIPHIYLQSTLLNARMNRLFMKPKDTLGYISAKVLVDVTGSDIDNIVGIVSIHDFAYELSGKKYYSDSIIIQSYINNSFRELTANSDNVEISMSGFRRFSDLPVISDLLLHDVLPKVTKVAAFSDSDPMEWSHNSSVADEQINFDVKFLDINSIVNIFVPNFYISKNSEIQGSYTFSKDSLWVAINAEDIRYNNFRSTNIILDLKKNNSGIKLDLTSDYLKTYAGIYFDTLDVHGSINMDTADFNISWGGEHNFTNKGNIEGEIYWVDTNSYQLSFSRGDFYVQDTLWVLNPNTKISSSHHFIKFTDLDLTHGKNSLSIYGQASDDANDEIICDFSNFDVSFIDFYLKRFDTNLDGYINGELIFSKLWDRPRFTGDIEINSFSLNDIFLNTLKFNTLYSDSREAIILDLVIGSDSLGLKYLDFGGFYYPFNAKEQFDAELRVNDFPLSSIGRYLTSFTSYVDGVANGSLRLQGSLDKPVILGRIKTNIDDILIDYTNVHYKINDYLEFAPTYFGFVDVLAHDTKDHDLKLTTKINHTYFTDLNLDIDVVPINAQLLNTTVAENELFYGKAFGNGRFQLKGPINDMAMKLRLKPNNKSYLAIPISSQSSAEYSDFLTFVAKDTMQEVFMDEMIMPDDEFRLALNMEIDIDPTTTIELVMDERVGDVITAHGSGKLKMIYDVDGNFKMFGKYQIDRGNYLFTMQSILNKRFSISSGSSIVWDGDVADARIDLKAVYRVDAKLYDLLQSLVDSASSTVYKKPSKVNCIINITGSLFDPNIAFDIKVPDESIADQELVKRLLSVESTGNSEEMNKNFVSLLILGRFQPPSGYEAGANPNMLEHNAAEILAEQVGNILNQVSDDVEIGLAWSPGDEVTKQEVAVALSYTMLDDRLVLDGKFGQGGGSTTESSARIVADMEIGYYLTPDGRIRAKVFNRTNYYDPLSRKAPYTQGVGVSFRKEFNNFQELFTPKNKQKGITDAGMEELENRSNPDFESKNIEKIEDKNELKKKDKDEDEDKGQG